MRVRTLALYLIGDRQAILDIAADRHALWFGFLFVLSAGFAREYDGQDLLREPWHLLIPVGASLAASFLLFLVVSGRLFLRSEGRPPFFAAYRSFLTLFWMTAPLAWLYAIPYERFLSPGAAASANLWTLALVAVWRAALMIRVVSVITDRDIVFTFLLVMGFADAVAMTAVAVMPKPVVSFMGGIRLTETEAAIQDATLFVICFGLLSAPFWLIGGGFAFFTERPRWQVPTSSSETTSANRGMWILAGLSLTIWIPILPWTQAEQQLRSRVERDMKAGRIAEALEVMSTHKRSDFPPEWDPPPREGYGEKSPHLFEVMEVLVAQDRATWIRAAYVDKLRRHIGHRFYNPYDYPNDKLGPLLRILRNLPEGRDILAENRGNIMSWLEMRELPEAERENLKAQLQKIERDDPKKR